MIRHICKNAAPPVLALMGLQFGYLLGGSILVETVFNWPGSGNLLNLAIFRRDIPVLQATILVLADVLRRAESAGGYRPGGDRSADPALSGAPMSHANWTISSGATQVAATPRQATPAPGYWKSVVQRLSRDPVTIAVTSC